MSYILNALKKSEQDRRQQASPPARPGADGAGARLAEKVIDGEQKPAPAGARPRRRLVLVSAGVAAVAAVAAALVGGAPRPSPDLAAVAPQPAPIAAPVVAPPAPEPIQQAPADAVEPWVEATPLAVAALTAPRSPTPAAPLRRDARLGAPLAGAVAIPTLTGPPLVEPAPPPPVAETETRFVTAARRRAGRTLPLEPVMAIGIPRQQPPRTTLRTPDAAAPVLTAIALPRPAKTDREPNYAATEIGAGDVAPVPEVRAATALGDGTQHDNAEIGEPTPPPVVAPAMSRPELVVAMAPMPRPVTDPGLIDKATDFNNLAWSLERDRLYEAAVDAFSHAIELRPDYGDAYFGRGWIYERMGVLDKALVDYSWAIKVSPRLAPAYNNRGIIRLYRNQAEEAAVDFGAALEIGDAELGRYAMLWRYVAIERAGGDGRGQLAADAEGASLRPWPGILVRFFLGEVGAEQVLAAADDPDPILRREKRCVGYFFLGQHHLLRGDSARAKAFFLDTVGTGVSAFLQYAAAERELERLALSAR